MSLKNRQTRIFTQMPNALGVLVGFIAASFRTWTWRIGFPANPTEVKAVALSVSNRDAIAVKGTIAFVADGGINNFLYAVDVSNPNNPAVLGHVDLSA